MIRFSPPPAALENPHRYPSLTHVDLTGPWPMLARQMTLQNSPRLPAGTTVSIDLSKVIPRFW